MTTKEALLTLDVRGSVTKTAIKKAFRQAALHYHPDTRGTDADFIRVKQAYDLLAILSTEELTKLSPPHKHQSDTTNSYDPFTDPEYSLRVFFKPDNLMTEGFERKLRAKGCPYCHELGFVTKNTDPSKGFMGRERRLCKCQWT